MSIPSLFPSSIPICFFLLLLVGCAAPEAGSLIIFSDNQPQMMAQRFDKAYIGSSREGEFDVILLQDPMVATGPLQKAARPLDPLTASDVRQVVHLRIYWQAVGGSVAKDGVVTNATINWYVMGHQGSDRMEVLRYEGAGYVVLDEGRKTTTVEVRDGLIRTAEIRGEMRDPIGPSRLVGNIEAYRATPIVENLLADLHAQFDRTSAPSTQVSQAR